MELDIKKEKDIIIIYPKGSIDSKTTGTIQNRIMENISDSTKVAMVFSDVDFVSSAGLRLLLMMYRQVKSKNGSVVLVDVSDEIQEVMEMTGFIKFFNFSVHIDDAIKTLSS